MDITTFGLDRGEKHKRIVVSVHKCVDGLLEIVLVQFSVGLPDTLEGLLPIQLGLHSRSMLWIIWTVYAHRKRLGEALSACHSG